MSVKRQPSKPTSGEASATAAGSRPAALSRRQLLGGGAALAGLALGGGAAAWSEETGGPAAAAAAAGAGAMAEAPAGAGGGRDRRRRAAQVRARAARLQEELPALRHPTNGDERELPRFIACFSKGLPHDRLGEVDARSYELLRKALASGDPTEFERLPLGGFVKLANPQAGLAYNLIGPDPSQVALEPPPRFASAEQAAELVELYWQALARDVNFADYESHPLIARAAGDVSRLSGYKGVKEAGRVTPRVLFRGVCPGDLAGPYVSQFLWKDLPLLPIRTQQKLRTVVPAVDYLTGYDDWLACQNGAIGGVNQFDGQARYVRNARDLGEYVHRDFTYQAPLCAALILGKMGAPVNGGNPYKHSRTQAGFTTFGPAYLLFLLALVTQVSLAAAWFQKWQVHRRLRPEELAGRVENHRRGRASYPLHAELLDSAALAEIERLHSTCMLPGAYPEGCPTHPSYPAGHAVIAGACVTVLKAFFDESYVVPEPVVPSADGLALRPYQGPPLTVGGELDKLAANIGMARDFAGIHWRSDCAQGLRFGEAAAMQVLRELKLTGTELFAGFSFRRFDGERVTV
jgi:hypothetical protein